MTRETVYIDDFAGDVPLGSNDATVRFGMIENTPGNTPLNESRGPLREERGKYGSTNQWRQIFNLERW